MPDRDLSDLTVLIADDGEISRRVAAGILKRIGVRRVIEADDGQAALDIVSAPDNVVDVIVADVRMPRLDGLEMARRIAQGDAGDRRPTVILLTAIVGHDSPWASDSEGVAAVLSKPANADKLRAALTAATG